MFSKGIVQVICVFVVFPFLLFCNPPSHGESSKKGDSSDKEFEFDVVFLHGLWGNSKTTWRKDEHSISFPKMLSEAIPKARVWLFSYDAEPTNWTGRPMPLFDRAKYVLEVMSTKNVGIEKPVVFVCHSMGGLVAKKVLQVPTKTESHKKIQNNIMAMVFLATPHLGSRHATAITEFGKISNLARPSVAMKDLRFDEAGLRELKQWFIKYAKSTPNFRTHSLAENKPIGGSLIVEKSSADDGVSDLIPFDKDHLTIAKPDSPDDPVFESVRNFIMEWSEQIREPEKVTKTKRVEFLTRNGDRAFDIMPTVRGGKEFNENPQESDFWGDLLLSCTTELRVHDEVPYVRVIYHARRKENQRTISTEPVSLENNLLRAKKKYDRNTFVKNNQDSNSRWLEMVPVDKKITSRSLREEGWKFVGTEPPTGFHSEVFDELHFSRQKPLSKLYGEKSLVSSYKLYGDQDGPDVPPRGDYTRATVKLNPITVIFQKETALDE